MWWCHRGCKKPWKAWLLCPNVLLTMGAVSSFWNVTGRLHPSFSLAGLDLLRWCLKFQISQYYCEFTVSCLHNATHQEGHNECFIWLWTEERNAGSVWSLRVGALTYVHVGMWIIPISIQGVYTNIYNSHFPCINTHTHTHTHICVCVTFLKAYLVFGW